jgi:GNAT superfamily N-acetyltransferase
MFLNEFRNVIKKTKKNGLLEGLRYLRGQIYFTKKFYVFRHTLKNIPDFVSNLKDLQFMEIDNPDCDIFKEIYKVWPRDDTKPNDETYMTELLRNRSENGAMCFVLLHEGHVIGANWLYSPNHYYLHFKIPYLPGEYISTWTFIVPDHRGIGASKFLKSNCLKIAKQRGISSVISITSSKNIVSIRMNSSVGFNIIGYLIEKHRWFRYSQYFLPSDSNE